MSIEEHIIQRQLNDSGGEQVAVFLKTKFVDELGCATSIEYDGAIKIVSDGLSVSIANDSVATLTYRNGQSRNYTVTYNSWVDRVYIAQTAIVVVLTSAQGSGTPYYYIFAKTNTNKMSIVVTGYDSPYSIYDVSSGDDAIATPSAYTRSLTHLTAQFPYSNQVQICQVACNSSPGVVSYLQDVYVATMTTLPAVRSTTLYDYILDNHHYLTDGAFWIKGDPV